MKRTCLYYLEMANVLRILYPDGKVEALYLNEVDDIYTDDPYMWFPSIFSRTVHFEAKKNLHDSHEFIGFI